MDEKPETSTNRSQYEKAPEKPRGRAEKLGGQAESAVYQELCDAVTKNKDADTQNLVSGIIQIITVNSSGNRDPSVWNSVKRFLQNEPRGAKDSGNVKIDECIRWILLYRVVNISDAVSGAAKLEARAMLSEILLKDSPYLAFENPYKCSPETSKLYKKNCLGNKAHGSDADFKPRNTPFRIAAECGNSAAIATMICYGRKFYERQPPFKSHPQRPEFVDSGDIGKFSYLPLSKILQQSIGQTNSTVLMLAARAESNPGNPSKTLDELLEVDDLAFIKEGDLIRRDETFVRAVEEGEHDIVDIFLKREHLSKIFVTTEHIVQALDQLTDNPPNLMRSTRANISRDNRLKIVRILVEKARNTGIIDRRVAEMMITLDLSEIWNKISSDALSQDLKDCLLHLAVKHQNSGFVDRFLRDYPQAVMQQKAASEGDKKNFPLWYNTHSISKDKDEGDDVKSSIRTAIVNKMVHEVADVDRLTNIFHSSDETFNELCFDMSGFNSASYRLSDFIDSLIQQSSRQRLHVFEETLRYAEFPSLDTSVEERESRAKSGFLQHRHTEVFRVLKWLRERGVESIIKLRVPDRLNNPHDDLKMASEVNKFKVEILDWRVLDLAISILEDGTKKRLKELHLYSSGNRAVISHWFSEEGIRKLKKLEWVGIKIVQETCTLKRCSELIRDLRLMKKIFLDKMAADEDKSDVKPPQIRIEIVPWFPTQRQADLSDIASRVAPKLARSLQNLKSIVASRDTRLARAPGPVNRFQRTKVAILDNGILSISPAPYRSAEFALPDDKEMPAMSRSNGQNGLRDRAGGSVDDGAGTTDQSYPEDDSNSLWTRIKEGASFVDGNSRLNPWLFATNAHGTQMANLICAIDPTCELYVARVAEDVTGITSKSVSQGIKWARKKKVDIISMSFTFQNDPGLKVRDEIHLADKEGIIMTCSTHDEFMRSQHALPAFYRGHYEGSMLNLAACDEYGKILRETQQGDIIDFLIRGENVPAGAVPFLESKDKVTGSSVSTALAAGLASLLLTCERLNNSKEYLGYLKDQRKLFALVKDQMQSRATTTGGQFLNLDSFAFFVEKVER